MTTVPQSTIDAAFAMPDRPPAPRAPRRTVLLHRKGPVHLLTARGVFDARPPAQWIEALTRLADSLAPAGAVIDAGGVDFLNSRGLEALLDFQSVAESRGTVWALVASRAVRRPLRALGADTIVQFGNADEAAAYCLRRTTV